MTPVYASWDRWDVPREKHRQLIRDTELQEAREDSLRSYEARQRRAELKRFWKDRGAA